MCNALRSGVLAVFSSYSFSHVIGWKDYTLVISFVSMGFPYKDQTEDLVIVNGLLYVFPTRTHCQLSPINFTFSTAQHTYERHDIARLC